MAETFFKNFPKLKYSNNSVIDITRSIGVTNRAFSSPYLYSPLDIINFQRPDKLADQLYSDPYLNWSIWVSNKIYDPYYEWYLTEDELYELIINKYGSIEESEKPVFYQVNYNESSEDKLSESEYNELAPVEYKYWEVVIQNNKISHYKRKELYWTTSTNAVIKYSLDNTSGLNIGDKVFIKLEPHVSGYGYIVSIDGSNIIINNITGDVYEHDDITLNNNSYLYKTEGINYIISDINILKMNISLNESKYWKPISGREDEILKNEYNRSIRIIAPEFINQLIYDTKEALK